MLAAARVFDVAGAGPNGGQAASGRRQEVRAQVDEKAYKAALERIPEPKEKYDPWSTARPTTPEKKRSK
jgi:hypothetical protein